jgi:tetratricopeptide (TPR) repeat protein
VTGRVVALAALLVALTVWIYSPVWNFAFVSYDDADFVTGNRGITSGFTMDTARYIAHNPYYATGGPLTWLSHVIDIELFGLEPRGHHVSSLLLHLVNVVLLFWLLRRLTGRVLPSAIVAALFAVHPVHVESVAWISQRKDVLSTLFWLLTLWSYQWYARAPGARRYLIVLVCFIAGLLSKPIVSMAPITMLLIDAWPLERIDRTRPAWPQWRRLAVEKLPFAALAVVSLWLTLQSQLERGAVTEATAPLLLRAGNATQSYIAYLLRLCWPAGLSPFYPYRWTLNPSLVTVSAAALLLITALAVRVRKQLPAVPVGWFWYLATLIPVIGFVKVGAHAMADRLTYVPSIGIFVAVVWATAAGVVRRTWLRLAALTAAALAVAALSVTARAQVWHWRSGEALWRHAIDVEPSNARALANLAATLAGEGRTSEALAFYRDAVRLTPDEPKLLVNYGMALAAIGDRSSALVELRRAIQLDPGYAKAHLHLADQLAASGRFDEAFDHYRTAIERDPTSGLARMNLSVTFAETGRLEDALEAASGAIALESSRADWRFTRAMMLKVLGRKTEAIRELEEVLRLQPGHTQAQAELAALR